MKHLSILIKPVSATCNMNCSYCFYYDEIRNRKNPIRGIMNDHVLKSVVEKAYLDKSLSVNFVFQGGEPLLIGLEFYTRFINYVKIYNKSNTPTNYSIQTNGTKITEEFASFFKKYNFLVGVSIDGDKLLNDRYRDYHDGSSSFEDTVNGIKHLYKRDIDYNIISVITDETVKNVKRTYEFLKNLGSSYIQFIPCIDSLDGNNRCLSSKSYGVFLKKLFDLWYNDFITGERVSIRMFDDILSVLLGFNAASCITQGKCIIHNVIEADGSVYPCDFYVLDEWYMGTILNDTFEKLFNSENAKRFVNQTSNISSKCFECNYFKLCKGGCKRNNSLTSDNSVALTRYCKSHIDFYNYTYNRFIEIAKKLNHELGLRRNIYDLNVKERSI